MRTTITRTITTSKIHTVSIVFENGTPSIKTNEPLTVNHEVREAEAQKLAKKAYGDGVTVSKIETVDTLYEISIDDFVKYGKPVEKAGEQK